ncbi:sulfotransferase [Pelagibius marinus]|uniref:sulfotransferase n=1 Tax=Pelagibius marinus TaxID=2762760 RepID=UPI0018731C4B|nr:sulfotransferase [Pelagibius marinus]
MGFELNYSALDRCLHRLAFGVPGLQLTAADLESRLYAADLRKVTAERPVFITSLPRAGTTLLLEVLHRFPAFATHCYRDMPFVMAPLVWARLSGGFRKRAELAERAHGDGMEIGFDSPEAFEEVLWRAFWPEKYKDDGIALWRAGDGKEEAAAFFAEHLKKIVALRRSPESRSGEESGRYLSKNNGNIARLDLLARMFPDARIVVPFRRPLEHAASLLRQHENFLTLHRDQPFVRRYMADIGHYEFGALHRPIAFPGLAELTEGRDPQGLDYWLAYWIAAFAHIAEQQAGNPSRILLLSYEDTCAGGRAALAALCARLDVDPGGELGAAAGLFKAPPPARAAAGDADPALLERAAEVEANLRAAAGA